MRQHSGTTANVQPIATLLEHLRALPRTETLLVGIDGPGGSGKSTVARALERLASDEITVVEMDDFYLPSSDRPRTTTECTIGAAFDWRRLSAQVLGALRAGTPGRYRRYDWDTDKLAEWRDVPSGGIVVVEGIYSTRSELAEAYDFRIWVTAPPEVRLERGLERDGEEARSLWVDEWMPEEDRYVGSDGPRERAHLVVDGASALINDPSRALAVVGGAALRGDAESSGVGCGTETLELFVRGLRLAREGMTWLLDPTIVVQDVARGFDAPKDRIQRIYAEQRAECPKAHEHDPDERKGVT